MWQLFSTNLLLTINFVYLCILLYRSSKFWCLQIISLNFNSKISFKCFLLWLLNFKSCLKRSLLLKSCKHIFVYFFLQTSTVSFLREGALSLAHPGSTVPAYNALQRAGIQEGLKAFHADRLCKYAFLSLSKFSLVSNLYSWVEVCISLLALC